MADRPSEKDRNVEQTINEAIRLSNAAKRTVDELVALLKSHNEGRSHV